ncbi:MAG: DUF2993 domain-containing protein [Leptolyngbya sp.]|nr:DUF2993 domain-containing protein [Leptolyngbya sp.]
MTTPSTTPLDSNTPDASTRQTVESEAGSAVVDGWATGEPIPSEAAEAEPKQADGATGRGLISRLLPPAIRLWLHSQLDHIEGLGFRLEGKDRQILSGHIPQVSLSAQQAVYRGLHVSQVAVVAKDIRVNLGQVLRGKPLRLLQAFPVEGQVYLSTEDVRASLHAPLLEQGLQDIFQRWAEVSPSTALGDGRGPSFTALPPAHQLTDIALGDGTLTLTWCIEAKTDQHLRLHTHLTMDQGRYFSLRQTEIQVSQGGDWAAPTPLGDVVMDLGNEAKIDHLTVTPEAMTMQGLVRVIP